MTVPSEAAFERLYRSLSAAERREFVAALWAASGWERVDGPGSRRRGPAVPDRGAR